MRQNRIVLGKDLKACVNTARGFDAKIDDFDHTALRRNSFALGRRRKCSTLLAVPCALLLSLAQNLFRLEKSIVEAGA